MASARAAAQVGNIMAEYPLDPQLAKMVVASPEFRWLQNAGWLTPPPGRFPPALSPLTSAGADAQSCSCYLPC